MVESLRHAHSSDQLRMEGKSLRWTGKQSISVAEIVQRHILELAACVSMLPALVVS